MPDLFTVNKDGFVVSIHRDRRASFKTVYGIGMDIGVDIYTGDPHDVISPPRINPIKRAAVGRKRAYQRSLYNCVTCGVDKHGHGWSSYWEEPLDSRACDEYVRPAPLVIR